MLNLFLASLFIVSVPHATMREKPSNNSPCVSEVYFSEEVQSLQETDNWVEIENSIDSYRGWVEKTSLSAKTENYSKRKSIFIHQPFAHLYKEPTIIYGPLCTIGFDTLLKLDEVGPDRWLKVLLPTGDSAYIQKGDVVFDKKTLAISELPELAKKFFNIPYTWGGRSSFGYDCSGFTQMLYRQAGIHLLRDAKDQIKFEGFKEISKENLKPGDLIFWGRKSGSIYHVAMFVENETFIHTNVNDLCPYVHYSLLSDPLFNGQNQDQYLIFMSAQ